MNREPIHTGDVFSSGIVRFTALCHATKSGHVIVRSHVSGRVFATRLDSAYTIERRAWL